MECKPCNAVLPLLIPVEGICCEEITNEDIPLTESSSMEKLRKLRSNIGFSNIGNKKKREEESMKKREEESMKKREEESMKKREEEDEFDNKELDEKDVEKYLMENKDNIILVFGQKIYRGHRSLIKKSIKQLENIFSDDSGKIYYQVMGRHLVDENEIKCLVNKRLSIFNISTLKNVIKVTNKKSPIIHSRGVYTVDAYTLDEYQEITSA